MRGASLSASDGCGVEVSLTPVARVDGRWVSGPCRAVAAGVSCATDAGELEASVVDGEVSVRLLASRDVTVEALGLDGAGRVPGADGWLSNGYQSWSQSGVVALGPFPADGAIDQALGRRGDAEVLRDGRDPSWTLTYVGGREHALFVGATTSSRLKPWIAVGGVDGEVRLRAAAGGTGERVALRAGETLLGERFFVSTGLPFDQYAARLPSRRAAHPVAPPVGWNSWYELWDSVDEAAVRDNARLAKAALAPVIPPGERPFVVVDDGWQRAWGDWRPSEARFPSGLDGLARDLDADGARLGVWLAPLLASGESEVWAAHPDWFVPGLVYPHPKHGDMRVLDVTHPGAAAHLTAALEQLVAWGVSLVKIDFLFAGTWDGARREGVTGAEAYERALSLVRAAVGEQTLIVAVGAPPLPTLAYADAWRVGPDIALEGPSVSWTFVAHEARALAARTPFCRATLCDADPPLLRRLSEDEVRAGAALVGFAGGGLFLSDDLRKLDPSRLAWGLDPGVVAAATSGRVTAPDDVLFASPPETLSNPVLDLVARSTSARVPLVWTASSGARTAWNSSDDAVTAGGIDVPAHASRALPGAPR
ncbi:MAG: alpha-galactosidase [Polyangiaceae bacterium]|nr:alpha-galactosidase [Polyangiaceae bacterium]